MPDIEKTMEQLKWNERLRKIRFGEKTEKDEKTNSVSNILITFIVGFLFGVIVAGILIPYLRNLF